MAFNYTVPSAWETHIRNMIDSDEGGWVLTDDFNDAGGLTYGGMTFKLYDAVMKKNYQESVYPDTFENAALSEGSDREKWLQDRIIQVYFDEFCYPLLSISPDNEIIPSVLSLAVNLGMYDLAIVMQKAANEFLDKESKLKVDGKLGPLTLSKFGMLLSGKFEIGELFCHMWEERYTDLVVKNCKYWDEFIGQYQLWVRDGMKVLEKPSPPRYKHYLNLKGWMNRVARYR